MKEQTKQLSCSSHLQKETKNKRDVRDRKKKRKRSKNKSTRKRTNKKDNTHPLSPNPQPNINQPPLIPSTPSFVIKIQLTSYP